MKYEKEISELLISNAIKLIAEGGFEKATTKELTHCSGDLPGFKMNEIYIYRIFGSKENLYAAAFATLDKELFDAFKAAAISVGGFTHTSREKIYEFLAMAWSFIVGNEVRCRCYIRYLYSIYFKDQSLENHNRLFKEIIAQISTLFKDEADVGSIMHSVFVSIFDFAIRVFNNTLEDSEENRPHIYNVIYCMMATYFKDPVAVP
ncbi:MAG: TetR/AcrR family transcriptional regulator [Clostridia bacterium]|nr:TetR/AcrR family transcriptional regulator [Clostridia bacterium]